MTFPKLHSLIVSLTMGIVFSVLSPASGFADEPQGKLTHEQASALFHDEILPILKNKCVGCHSEGKYREAGLDLRTKEALFRGGDSGPAVIPGKPDKSRLYIAVTWKDEDLLMPPKERNRLSPEQIQWVRAWIEAGAPWPAKKPIVAGAEDKWNNKKGLLVSTSGGLSEDWTNRQYLPQDIWAYHPIARPKVPQISNEEINNPIDAFVLKKLKENELEPASPTDKRTLIRRTTINLTGLPPTPEEVQAFINDNSAKSFENLVERLLASKQYGEQAARHWLDVVRYADTSGFSNDYERPNAWRYRDYVVRSFNDDKPYNRFVVEQLAGDELDPTDPEMLIAAGFLRMGPWEHTGMSVAAVTRQHFLDDITNSIGVTFLGQGLRCAKCHDHKFDPIPTRDYYRIQAIFAPVQFADRDAKYLPHEDVSSFPEDKKRSQRLLKDANDFLASLNRKHNQAVAQLLKERGVKNVKELPEQDRPRRHFGLTSQELTMQKVYNKRRNYYEREMKRYQPLAFSVYSGPFNNYTSVRSVQKMPVKRSGQVADVCILQGGSIESPGEQVTPGVLSAVHGSNDKATATGWNTIPDAQDGRRLALAKWIASPNNTLTARVIVNRIWQQHFGNRGIVATPNNFGKMGAKPTHPELLDWLATWFIDHNWSIKKLHRLILSSKTYQQASHHPQIDKLREVDPNNQLLAFYPTRRMAAEEIRDSMLAVSGELNRALGGPGVFPEINWEVAMQPRHIMGSVAPAYQPSPLPKQRNRRTIYAFRYRTLPDPMLEVFNRPGSETSCECRDETTVTPQAFALFNGQFSHDRALAMAARLEKLSEDRNDQIEHAFRLTHGRATKTEREACMQHVRQMTAHHETHPPVKSKLPTVVQRQMVEELTGEVSRWEEELDVMKNYTPDLKPWDVEPRTRALAELCLVLLNSNEFLYVR